MRKVFFWIGVPELQSGKFLLKFGSSGSTAGQFNKPKGIAFDSSGNIFVLDQDNHRIQKFDREGAAQHQWGGKASMKLLSNFIPSLLDINTIFR